MKVLLILLWIFILRRNNDHILTDSKFVELQDAQLIRQFFSLCFSPVIYIPNIEDELQIKPQIRDSRCRLYVCILLRNTTLSGYV